MDAVLHFAAVEHTGAAVDNHTERREVQGIRAAAGEDQFDVLAGVLTDPPRKLDRPDVITLPVMRAAFGDEDFVAVLQGINCFGTADEDGKAAFIAGEEDGEGREGNIFGRIRRDFGKDLRIGDDETGLFPEGGQRIAELIFLGNDRHGVGLEDVADHLLLREDQAAFGCGFVNGDDKHDEIGRGKQISDEMEFIFLFGEDMYEGLL